MPKRPPFRYLALVLAAVQLLAFAGAPVLEAVTVESYSVAPLAVDEAQSSGRSIHDPGTCPACQLLGAHARRPEAARIAIPTSDACSGMLRSDGTSPQGAPRAGFLSRAPPLAVA